MPEPAKRVDHNSVGWAGCLDEELGQALGHDCGVQPCWTFVLVVGLTHGDHVAGIGAVVTVGPGAIPAEPGLGVPAAVSVEGATGDFRRVRLVRYPHSVQVEVRFRTLREVVDVLERVFRARSEPSWDSVRLLPDVGLVPTPAHVLQRQHQLVHVRVALAPQPSRLGDPILDVQHERAGLSDRDQHGLGKGNEPLHVSIRRDAGVGASVRVRGRHEEQVHRVRRESR